MNRIRSVAAFMFLHLLPIGVVGNEVWRSGFSVWAKLFAPIGAIYLWTIALIVLCCMTTIPIRVFDMLFPEDTQTALS